jgi:hypothetical protein
VLGCLALAAAGAGPAPGPYDIALAPGPAVPSARGSARLVFADSPFGVAATADGRLRFDIRVSAAGLPAPARLGAFRAYVAWEVNADLSGWQRLGVVTNGVSTVGVADRNKFLFIVTAEADTAPAAHAGPVVLHGTSPSGWLQQFFGHPLFRGAPG